MVDLPPEFAFLPRKFKIAVNAAAEDRAVIRAHDIGLDLVGNEQGEIGFRVFVGGGLGRTPILGKLIREFLPRRHLLSYLDAILRLYNRYGRRDNMYKARIKILVQALGIDEFGRQVEAEWSQLRDGPTTVPDVEFARLGGHFAPPPRATLPAEDAAHAARLRNDPAFANWVKRCVHASQDAGLRRRHPVAEGAGVAPGDISDVQMIAVAELAERFSFGELRVSHEQNVVLADVRQSDLHEVWQIARRHRLATANIGLLTDMICCPGGDLCALANARRCRSPKRSTRSSTTSTISTTSATSR
jgi:sulfite reductase (NADPH) hemoprotein beta-component